MKEIPIEIKEGFRDYRTFGGQCHEAGFDAFMTGCAFVKMFNFLHVVSKSKQPLSLDLPIAAPFRNRISNNSSYDIIHVSLDRRDKTPKRENCFHIKFPEEWRQSDIYCKYFSVTFEFTNTVVSVLAGKTYAFFLKTRKSVSLSRQNQIFSKHLKKNLSFYF